MLNKLPKYKFIKNNLLLVQLKNLYCGNFDKIFS